MNSRAVRYLVIGAAAVAAAACADKSSAPLAPSDTPSFSANAASGQDVAAIHIMQTKANAMADAAKSAGGGGGGGTGIFYHGGPVLQAGTNVAAIYWAAAPIYNNGPAAGTSGSGANDGSLVGFFLNHVGGSPYYNINHTYTNGTTAIVNSVTYTQYWANNTNVPANGASVSDAQMVAMLQAGFNSGAITYDASTLYHIFTGGTVNLGGGFGTQYCAYHTHGTVTINGVAKTVLYSAMPYTYAYASACTNQTASPNGDPAADAEINVIAHETEETTTDMMGTAWYDRRGYENADKCAWTWGTTYTTANGGLANMNIGGKDFLVQRNWVNAGSGGCVTQWP